MSLNATPRGDRIHIALFGKRNAGKSSVINAMTNQELAIVSDVKGTTTDPVYKAMELLPLGPVVMIDTPGLDDEGELGEKRVKKAKEVLGKADIALVIMDATAGMTEFEEDMIRLIEDRKIPYLKVYNKMDLSNAQEWKEDKACFVSAKDKKGIWELKEEIGKLVPTDDDTLKIVGDLVCPNDFVILVVPIDSAAPKGRLILPQQQTIRDLLEAGAASIVVRETELEKTLEEIGKKPALVITDSQAFGKVSKIVPEDIKLTSFSILFARYKGDLEEEVRGVKALEHLEEGAKILIAEGCTHHRQCDDIGTVKIPLTEILMTGRTKEGMNARILWEIRLPRTLAAGILGGALALAGYLLQTFFHNPIAGPFVLGISSGAKMVVALVMVLLLGNTVRVSSGLLILAAFLGAMLSMGFVLLMTPSFRA